MRTQIKIVALAILTIAFALGAAVMPAMASGTLLGESEGNFTLDNEAPWVTAVVLYNGAMGATQNGMVPAVAYSVKVSVTDNNTLNDLNDIEVTLWTNKSTLGAGDSEQYHATYTWTHGGGESGWDKTGPGTGWSAAGATSVKPTLTDVSGDFWIVYTPSAVANESITSYCDWNITAVATDNASESSQTTQEDRSMAWYGDIAVNSGSSSFAFPALTLNTVNNSMTGDDLSFKAISNGYYQLQSKTESWENTSSGRTVTLATVAPGVNELSLKNNNTATGTTANRLTTSYADVTGYSYVTPPTAATGHDKSVYMWLDLGTKILPYNYSGTYFMQISNDG